MAPEPASAVPAGAVLLSGDVAGWYWCMAEKIKREHTRDGGVLPPRVLAAQDVLRAAWMAGMSAHGPNGQDPSTPADISPESEPKRYLMTTTDMATRLHCGERHARRLAREHGIRPLAKNLWDRADVATLEAHRRG